MINSVNSLEFLKSKLLTMDKYSSKTDTKLLPPSSFTQAKTFATICDHQKTKAVDSFQKTFLLNNEIKNQDRVRVQHVENHTKLQNNKCCNTFRTLYNNISASSNVRDRDMLQMYQTKDDNEIDVVNVEHLNSTTETPLNIQIKSAFNVDFNNKYRNNNRIVTGNFINYIGNNKINASQIEETNKSLKFRYKPYNNYGHQNKLSETTTRMIAMATESQINTNDSQRTKDQDNAYRHIESVHNYAKSKSYEGDDDDKISPNGSRHSSYLSDDEEDDDEDNDGAEYDNDIIDYEDDLPDDLDTDYEDIFSKRRFQRFQKLSTSADDPLSVRTLKLISNRKSSKEVKEPASFANILTDNQIQVFKPNNNQTKNKCVDEEDHVDVDVETIEPPFSPITSSIDTNCLEVNICIKEEYAVSVKPDHHARRPMNAFLIFCKRHRAIVKDRYKNLENRAITKILGDWWASLETNEKKCFTNLAQQNKDAFFSANPNFKWYKLPAPPLRTLTTRPGNTFGQEYQEDNAANGVEMINNITSYNNNPSNYFKLADEAQMGDLSQLMQNKSKTITQCADLQQALSETSQYMSTHITCKSEIMDEKNIKREFYNETSFSSNSSEEDIVEPKKKSSRSCKGKRYQELINSGQIATAVKKTKCLSRPMRLDTVASSDLNIKQENCSSNDYNFNNLTNNDCQKRSLMESENMMSYDINSFDLEEKIKELPALNLDDYLQRKRNTKKKKKFSTNGKKRGQRSNNNNNNNDISITNKDRNQLVKHYQQQPTSVVGSQKRKARKESITRRDVSAIEQEVASLLPLTINGCCYFQEAPKISKYNKNAYEEEDSKFDGTTTQSLNFTSVSPIIPVQQNSFLSPLNNTIVSNNNNIINDNISSSTSDLLILAEVAANRTEIKQELL